MWGLFESRDRDCRNRAKNEKDCPCLKLDCKNHGICCACIAKHRAKNGYPACMIEVAQHYKQQ